MAAPTITNYTKPLILTVGSRGLSSTAADAASAVGTDSTDDYVLGTSDNDILTGGVATFVFNGTNGEGLDGSDTMEGGAGDDQYIVNDMTDKVVENYGEGSADTVFTAVSFTLSDNVENIVIKQATEVAVQVTGNKLDNILDGSQTPTKADSLVGGDGSDTYIIGGTSAATRDIVMETSKTGTADTIVSGLSTVNVDISKDSKQLIGAVNIENVILLDSATGLTVTGNASANRLVGNDDTNTLIGNDGNDTLDGGFEAAAAIDSLDGGRGNDTYIVRNSSDVVKELSNAGTDTVKSYSTYDISATANANIENIWLLGSSAINATGNGQANALLGNSGANSLVGGTNNDTLTSYQGADTLDGGVGSDSLTGGDGSDTYVVDSTTDKVIESNDDETTGGDDTVISNVSYVLGVNVENLSLGTWAASAFVSSGTSDINGTGNSLDNDIKGNAGDNIINGGIGDDTMTGNGGDDTFIVDSTDDVVTGGVSVKDLVKSSVDFSLATDGAGGADTAVDNLTLIDNPITKKAEAINGTGNSSANIIIGNDADNDIAGGNGGDTLYGDTSKTGTKGGSDTIDGEAGNDKIYGYAGTDTLDGGTGVDTIYGGEGDDVIQDTDASGTDADQMYGENGNDSLTASGGTDTLDGGAGNDTLTGGAAANNLVGGVGNDSIIGSNAAGTDTIDGGAGNDVIDAQAGTDSILGGDGNDTITGGADRDVITTGKGNDTIIFSGAVTDTVATTSTVTGVDLINDLTLSAATGDLIDLDVSVATVGSTVSGTVSLASFQTDMNVLLAASGVGFDTTKTGDISAAVVKVTGGTGITTNTTYLAVDYNNDNAFTVAADFVIDITGSTYSGMTVASFV